MAEGSIKKSEFTPYDPKELASKLPSTYYKTVKVCVRCYQIYNVITAIKSGPVEMASTIKRTIPRPFKLSESRQTASRKLLLSKTSSQKHARADTEFNVKAAAAMKTENLGHLLKDINQALKKIDSEQTPDTELKRTVNDMYAYMIEDYVHRNTGINPRQAKK
jgi:hypothetical protein